MTCFSSILSFYEISLAILNCKSFATLSTEHFEMHWQCFGVALAVGWRSALAELTKKFGRMWVLFLIDLFRVGGEKINITLFICTDLQTRLGSADLAEVYERMKMMVLGFGKSFIFLFMSCISWRISA